MAAHHNQSTALGFDPGVPRVPIVAKVEWAVEPARAPWWNAWVAEAQEFASAPSLPSTTPLVPDHQPTDPQHPRDQEPAPAPTAPNTSNPPNTPSFGPSSRSGPRPLKMVTPEYKEATPSPPFLSSTRARALARTRMARLRSLPSTTTRSVSASAGGIVPIVSSSTPGGASSQHAAAHARRVLSTPSLVRPTTGEVPTVVTASVPLPRRALLPEEEQEEEEQRGGGEPGVLEREPRFPRFPPPSSNPPAAARLSTTTTTTTTNSIPPDDAALPTSQPMILPPVLPPVLLQDRTGRHDPRDPSFPSFPSFPSKQQALAPARSIDPSSSPDTHASAPAPPSPSHPPDQPPLTPREEADRALSTSSSSLWHLPGQCPDPDPKREAEAEADDEAREGQDTEVGQAAHSTSSHHDLSVPSSTSASALSLQQLTPDAPPNTAVASGEASFHLPSRSCNVPTGSDSEDEQADPPTQPSAAEDGRNSYAPLDDGPEPSRVSTRQDTWQTFGLDEREWDELADAQPVPPELSVPLPSSSSSSSSLSSFISLPSHSRHSIHLPRYSHLSLPQPEHEPPTSPTVLHPPNDSTREARPLSGFSLRFLGFDVGLDPPPGVGPVAEHVRSLESAAEGDDDDGDDEGHVSPVNDMKDVLTLWADPQRTQEKHMLLSPLNLS